MVSTSFLSAGFEEFINHVACVKRKNRANNRQSYRKSHHVNVSFLDCQGNIILFVSKNVNMGNSEAERVSVCDFKWPNITKERKEEGDGKQENIYHLIEIKSLKCRGFHE